jgi:hypothetical protein
MPKCILSLKNMGFCSVATRRLQSRRSDDDAEARAVGRQMFRLSRSSWARYLSRNAIYRRRSDSFLIDRFEYRFAPEAAVSVVRFGVK